MHRAATPATVEATDPQAGILLLGQYRRVSPYGVAVSLGIAIGEAQHVLFGIPDAARTMEDLAKKSGTGFRPAGIYL